MAHAIDRDALNEGQFDGRGFPTETTIPQDVRYYPQIEQAIARYPYDPRRTEQLMVEAGFARDTGGLFAVPSGERVRPDFWMIQGPLFEAQQAIMAETWSRAGLDTVPRLQSPAQLRDSQAAATFSGLSTRVLGGGEDDLSMFSSGQIGAPANRWQGNNRGGWVNPEFDRLFDLYHNTLDRAERDRQVIGMVKVTTEELPIFPIYFSIDVLAHLAKIQGPAAGVIGRLPFWNVHEWQMD
jgi:ABC-type transport system substrate-binding protein